MEKLIKKLIIIISIMIIIIIGILIYLLNNNADLYVDEDEGYYPDYNVSFRNEIQKVNTKYEFFDTLTCIRKYTNLLEKLDKRYYQNEEGNAKETIQIYKEQLYNLLDKEYINQNKLAINNIDNSLSKYYTNLEFQVKEMYALDVTEHFLMFFVYGDLINIDNNSINEYGFIVKRDTSNLTFSILPYEYMLEKGYTESKIENANLDNIKNSSIIENGDNYYTSDAYDSEYIANYYFDIYKKNLQFDVESIYNSMNKEYREKRFGNLQNYKQYVSKNYDELLKCNMNQYTTEINDSIKSYICKDQFNNYYIFNETNIGEYTIMLDTYTIEQEKFKEKYELATNNEKVGMNISKFFQMINTKDYSSAYSILSTNFKNNNFKTEELFEQYIKTRLYSYNDVNLINFSDEVSGVFIYYIEITNKENETSPKIKMNIIMELLEDTEYRLSFEVIG